MNYLFRGDEIVEFSNWFTSWKIIVELMTHSGVISEVDALKTYFVLIKAWGINWYL
jgi:hypothetical protein